jgi:hypothetical protein
MHSASRTILVMGTDLVGRAQEALQTRRWVTNRVALASEHPGFHDVCARIHAAQSKVLV